MNKYFKVVLCFIAFIFCSFMVVLGPSISAVSAMEYTKAEYNLAINSIKMPTKVDPKSEVEKAAQSIAIKAYEKVQKEQQAKEGNQEQPSQNDDNTVDADYEDIK